MEPVSGPQRSSPVNRAKPERSLLSAVSAPQIVLRLPRFGPAAFAARIPADFRDDDGDIILRDRFGPTPAGTAARKLIAAT